MKNLKTLGIFILLVSILMGVVGVGLCDSADYDLNLKMMTGSVGGAWNPVGAAITELIQDKFDGVIITLMPGGGISNMAAIQEGLTDIGFGKSATTADAILGNPPFETPCTKVRNLFYLMQEVFQIVVPKNSDIYGIEDLRGKIVNTSTRGSSVEFMFSQILEAYGMTYDDFKDIHFTNYSSAVEEMKDRKADAWVLSTALPAAVVMDLAFNREIRLVSIDNEEILKKINEINPAFVPREIPAGKYGFMDEPITGITTSLHLACSSDLSEDFVYDFVKTVAENVKRLGEVHVDYLTLTPELMAKDIGIPFHPGALRYYREVGLIK